MKGFKIFVSILFTISSIVIYFYVRELDVTVNNYINEDVTHLNLDKGYTTIVDYYIPTDKLDINLYEDVNTATKLMTLNNGVQDIEISISHLNEDYLYYLFQDWETIAQGEGMSSLIPNEECKYLVISVNPIVGAEDLNDVYENGEEYVFENFYCARYI